MSRFLISVAVLSIFQVACVLADYKCLCNYDVELTVFAKPSSESQVVGYLYEFDCKSVYGKTAKDSKFQSVQYEHQVGYVEISSNIQIQICQGTVPGDDMVTTTTTTTTQSMLTSTPQPAQIDRSTLFTTTDRLTSSTKASSQQNISGHPVSHGLSPSAVSLSTPITTSATTMPTITSTTTTQTTTTTPTTTSTTTTPTTMSTQTQTTTTIPTTTSTTKPTTTSTTTTPTTTSTTTPTTTPTTTTPTTTSTTTPTTTSTTTTPTTTTTTQAPKPSCPAGWVMHSMSCYLFQTSHRRHWNEANNSSELSEKKLNKAVKKGDCVNRKSHLAIIETDDEHNFLKAELGHRINTHDDDDSDSSAWVSGRDNNREGTWEWYDGITNTYKPFTYTHWGDDEPDAGGHEHEEDCMTMVGNHHFKWADYSCDENMYYVCEMSALHGNPVTQAPAQTQNPSKISNANCPSGWITNQGSCYLFHTNDRISWSHANSFCSSQHAHLAIIETAEEDRFIGQQSSQRIDAHDGHDTHTGIWVAGTDDDHEGRWEWADGSSNRPIQGYTNWHKGEPDSGDHDHDEDCMCLIGNKGFEWQDYSCDKHMYFVCEKSATSISPIVG